jgi:hypothetical protein
MRKKKQEKLAEELFWGTFYYMNVPKHFEGIPEHVEHVRFRLYDYVDDDHLRRMVEVVKSVGMLDLDATEITNLGVKELVQLDNISELRLKGCRNIDNGAMDYICQLKGLTLLHLIGTEITTDGFEKINHLKNLQKLLIRADIEDPKLEEIYANLAPGCKMIVNYKEYPFNE